MCRLVVGDALLFGSYSRWPDSVGMLLGGVFASMPLHWAGLHCAWGSLLWPCSMGPPLDSLLCGVSCSKTGACYVNPSAVEAA